jgi:protein phosphatase
LALFAEVAARTDTGLVRRNNEDDYGYDDGLGLYVVCDGMGGAAGGEVASKLAVDTFLVIARQEILSLNGNCDATELALRRAVAAANRAVVVRAGWDICYRGMGTTLVGARLCGDRLTIVHVGDSRAYLLRDGHAVQLTEDHSYVAEQMRMGRMGEEQAASSSMQSVITRAIGADADVQPDVREVRVQNGDWLLLASDGLTRRVSTEEMAEAVASAGDAVQACERLVALANQQDGSDNITCVVVRVGERL